MSRAVPEWIGTNDDAKIPTRVQLRVYTAAKGKCIVCTLTSDGYEIDHIVPLILGGQHRESNLQLVCKPCHKAKTKLEVKLKSKVARVKARHIGIKKPSRFPGSRDSGIKMKIGGGWEYRSK